MFKYINTIIIFILLSGCQNRKKDIVIISINGSSDFKSSLYSGLIEFDHMAKQDVFIKNGTFQISITESQIKPSDTLEVQDKIADEDSEYSGIADVYPNFCKIIISNKKWENINARDMVVLHEIGHCVGLDHPKKEIGTVMDGTTENDASELRQIQNIPYFLETMKELSEINNSVNDELIFLHPYLNLFQPFKKKPLKPDF
jgi:hypothetical protein